MATDTVGSIEQLFPTAAEAILASHEYDGHTAHCQRSDKNHQLLMLTSTTVEAEKYGTCYTNHNGLNISWRVVVWI